MDFHAEANTQT